MQPEIIKLLLEYATTSNLLLFPIIILISSIVFIPKIIEIYDSWKMRKINALDNLKNNNTFSQDIQELLQDEHDNAAFTYIKGIKAEAPLRKSLYKLNKQNPNVYTWKRFRMARPYIDMDDNGVTITITLLDRLFNALAIVGIILSFIFIVIYWFIYTTQQDLLSFISFFIVLSGAMLVTLMFAYQLAQCHHANQLSKAIKKPQAKEGT